MSQFRAMLFAALAALASLSVTASGRNAPADEREADPAVKPPRVVQADMPSSADEARGRAKLLHETLHGTLQYMHREYFREGEKLAIPAATMKNVFRDLEATRGVKVRWMAVNARAMSVDHEPADAFEKEAAAAIGEGKEFHEAVEDSTYRYVGAIALHAECLKCHLPARRDNKPRAAGVAISLPIRKPKAATAGGN